MTICEIIEDVKTKMCDDYCKYPEQEPPEGKSDNWLYEDGSPCETCPLNNM